MDIETTKIRKTLAYLVGDGSEAPQRAARFLKSIAHRDRLKILCTLVDQELSVSEIEDDVGIRQSAISQHLSLMKDEGLLKARRNGRQVLYSISDPTALNIIMLLYERFCKH